MSESAEGWGRVLKAFDDWISYESSEFAPWTAYFSPENLRDLTDKERMGWMHSMYSEVIPGRVESCKSVAVAFEDFLPYMPDPASQETVRSMIDLSTRIQDSMRGMSDVITTMMEEYKVGGLDEAFHYLSSLADAEEDIRHHMTLYSAGFRKLKKLGLTIPEEMM